MSNLTVERPPRRRFLWKRQDIPGVAMAAPGVIGLLLFVAAPFLVAVFLSFYNAQLNSPRSPNFIGITQYTRLFADSQFWRALGNNLTFAAVVIPVQTAIALGLAMLINQRLRGISIYRALFFLPVIFPMALVAVIWRLILSRSETRAAELPRALPDIRACGSPGLARQLRDRHAVHHLAVHLAGRWISDDHPPGGPAGDPQGAV